MPGALPLTAASSLPSGRYTTSVRAPTMPRPWSTISAMHPLELGLAAHRAGDLSERLEPLHAARQASNAALELVGVQRQVALRLLSLGDVAAQSIREPADDHAGHEHHGSA